jgi:hypothetical protein
VTSANTHKADRKRRLPRTAWKKGQSGNPTGAPKRGESWSEIIKRIGDMTPDEAATKFGEVAKQIRNMPDGVTLKELVVMRVYASMLFEPAPGLFSHLLDRVDGAVTQKIEGDGTQTIVRVIYERSNGEAERTSPDARPDNRQQETV